MVIAIRIVLVSGLFLCVICCLSGNAASGGGSVAVPGCGCTTPAVVQMPLGSFADVRDFPGGAVYGGSYRMMSGVLAPLPRRAVRRVVKYGRSDFVGPRGYAAVISPWPLVPVTTASQPFGVGVVPLGDVVAWQSPRGYFYRSNYQSAVMQPCLPGTCPQSPGISAESVEAVPQGTFATPLEPIPAPPAENGPEF